MAQVRCRSISTFLRRERPGIVTGELPVGQLPDRGRGDGLVPHAGEQAGGGSGVFPGGLLIPHLVEEVGEIVVKRRFAVHVAAPGAGLEGAAW